MHVEVLLVETFICEADLVDDALPPVVQGEVTELQALGDEALLFLHDLVVVTDIFEYPPVMLLEFFLDIIDVCKCRSLLFEGNLKEWYETFLRQSNVDAQTLIPADSLLLTEKLQIKHLYFTYEMHILRPEELRGKVLIFLCSEVGGESEMHSLLGIDYKVSYLLCI